jgi:hypothetical protein
MLRLYGQNDWDQSWAVVTEVVVAERYLIAVSEGRGGKATFDLGIDGGSAGPITLAKAGVDASVVYQQNTSGAYISVDPAVVMYRAFRVFDSEWLTEVGTGFALRLL